MTLGYVDRTTMTAGLGPTIDLTGDVRADMDVIRAFYADKAGLHPELRTEPRLAAEAIPDPELAHGPSPAMGAADPHEPLTRHVARLGSRERVGRRRRRPPRGGCPMRFMRSRAFLVTVSIVAVVAVVATLGIGLLV